MSTTKTYQIQNIIEVACIKVVEPKELLVAEQQINELVNAKLTKILECFPSCEKREANGNILIIDELGIAMDLKEVSEAYGIVLIEEASVKGKTYRFYDKSHEIFELLKNNKQLSELYSIIKRGEKLLITETEKIQVNTQITTYDGRETNRKVINRLSIGTDNAAKVYDEALAQFSNAVREYVAENNIYMMNGTTALVISRAKRMGYNVQKKQNGQQIELVLVRMQG